MFSGTATAVVALTGDRAVFGHIAESIAVRGPPSDFEAGLSRIARLLLAIIAVMAPLVFLINWLTKGDWFGALLFAMAVGVGLVPEMLPMLVTVNLARRALAMSRGARSSSSGWPRSRTWAPWTPSARTRPTR
ncbi:P-type ATPase [Cupriavidus necator]